MHRSLLKIHIQSTFARLVEVMSLWSVFSTLLSSHLWVSFHMYRSLLKIHIQSPNDWVVEVMSLCVGFLRGSHLWVSFHMYRSLLKIHIESTIYCKVCVDKGPDREEYN